MFKKMREPVSGLTHYFSGVAAVIGLIVLLILSGDDLLKQRSMLVYGSSLVLLFMASAAYHLIQGKPERIQFLRKLDHAAIFVLIAGSYTPICINQFTGFWRWGILLIVWSMALVGSASKIFIINTPRWFTAGIYLIMGWVAIIGIGEIVRALPVGGVTLLIAGGVIFTLGAIVYITKTMNFKPGVFGYHEVWHLFVMGGAACHYSLMLFYIAPLPRVI